MRETMASNPHTIPSRKSSFDLLGIRISAQRQLRFLRALRHVGGVAVLLQLAWLTYILTHPDQMGADSVQVWFQAERIRSGEPLYHPMDMYGPDVMIGDLHYPLASNSPYLPPIASLVALLPRTEMETFARAAHIVFLAFFWGYAAILGRLGSGRWTFRSAFTAHGFLLLWPGSLLTLAVGNIEPLLWCLFGLAFLNRSLQGALLTAMAGVKVHAAWPLLFLLTRSPRRALGSSLAAAFLLSVVTLAGMGTGAAFRAALDWIANIPPALGQGTFLSANVSLTFLPIRVARWIGWEYGGGPLPGSIRLWLVLSSTLTPLVAGWLTRHRMPEVQMSIVFAAALLASPLCWFGYLTALFAPLAWWVGRSTLAVDGGCESRNF